MANPVLSRRGFLRHSALGASAILLAACAPQVVKETVVVEKEVEKEVTTIVKEEVAKEVTRVIEKIVDAAPKTAEEILGPDLVPGSPNHAKGWKTTLPDLPAGYPASSSVTISCSRRVDADTKFLKGDSLEYNTWTRMMETLFNVKFTVAWTWSTSDEAQTKYNLGMASGDLPDLLETVPATIYVKMVEADLLQEMGESWDMYASERWKTTFREYGDLPWLKILVNNRRMGIPRVSVVAQDDTVLWYREDWLEKVGMSVPTTLDELHDLALAFKNADLGQGDKGTTIGLLANSTYAHTWFGSLDPIWGAHGVIPMTGYYGQWNKVGSDLMYDAIRPEIKDALALLVQWYADGVFRKDFFTITPSECMSDVAGNLCGLHFTPSWGANQDSVKNDPNARWKFADIPSGPGGKKGKWTLNPFMPDPMCCRKGFEYVKEYIEIENWMIELKEDPWRRMHGWEGYDYEWDGDKVVATGVSWENYPVGPMGTRGGGWSDPYAQPRIIQYKMDEWSKVPADQRDAQMNLFFEDPTGVTQISNEARLFITEQAKSGVGMLSEFQGMATPTMVQRWADLTKIQDEAILSIIIGEKPLSAFDDFVSQWKAMGGDKITDEVNEWYRTNRA